MKTFCKYILAAASVSFTAILMFGACATGGEVTSQAVSAPTQNAWTSYSSSTKVNRLAFDKSGYLWAATDSGLIRVDTSTNTYLKYDIFNSGIVSNVVNTIAIDSSGNKWLGTGEGVARFDGTAWTTYTTADGLADNQVNAVAIDSAGNKWFGTNDGVSEMSGATWTSYTTADGLADNTVNCIVIDKAGNEWFGTDGGLSCFDGRNWVTYHETADGLPSDYVSCLAVDSAGVIWVGGIDHPEVMRTIEVSAVSRFDGNTWVTYSVMWGGISGNNVNVLAPVADGSLWAGAGAGPGLLVDGKWITYDSMNSSLGGYASDLIGTDGVNDIVFDNLGVVWFATDTGITEKDGSKWANLNFNQNGPANNSATNMAIDSAGFLWCTSWGYSDGLSVFDGNDWKVYSNREDGFPEGQFGCLFIDKSDNKWLGSYSSGVIRFDGETATVFTKENSGLADNGVYSILQDKAGNMWFDTESGVSELTGMVWTNHGDLGQTMALDSSGNIWFGINRGLRKYNGITSTDYLAPKGTTDLWAPTQISVDKNGNIWFSLFINAGGGIGKFDGTHWTFYTKTDGLLDDQVNAIAVDKSGNVWCATNYGLSEFNGITWTSFTPANSGIVGGQVESITFDEAGNMWVGSYSDGVCTFGPGVPATQVISLPLLVNTSEVWPVSKDQAISTAMRLLPPSAAGATFYASLQNGTSAQGATPIWSVILSNLDIPRSTLDWQAGPDTIIQTAKDTAIEDFVYFDFNIDAITGNVISKSAYSTVPTLGGEPQITVVSPQPALLNNSRLLWIAGLLFVILIGLVVGRKKPFGFMRKRGHMKQNEPLDLKPKE